eukprot:scaffold3076_cov248-Pinguiococcus_pyrenoidosus.AAC.2
MSSRDSFIPQPSSRAVAMRSSKRLGMDGSLGPDGANLSVSSSPSPDDFLATASLKIDATCSPPPSQPPFAFGRSGLASSALRDISCRKRRRQVVTSLWWMPWS